MWCFTCSIKGGSLCHQQKPTKAYIAILMSIRVSHLLEWEGRQLLCYGLGPLHKLTLKGKERVVLVEARHSLPIGIECIVVMLLESL
jgi:hypothetical protein